jgi:RNA polymerase sigma factor for flagellar operon FliA
MPDQGRLTAGEAEQLWRRWRFDRETAARDRLVLAYAPLVRYLARRKAHSSPATVSMDDLEAAGLLRLVQAVDGFDPALGATFEQYAWTRVAGGIVDELRRQDWAPRAVRHRLRRIETAAQELRATLHRRPTVAEIARRLDADLGEVREALEHAHRADLSSLNALVSDGEQAGLEVIETIAGDAGSAEDAALARERAGVIRGALATLNDRERLIVQTVFIDGHTAREASRLIGVSESRVSQVVREIRAKLLEQLAGYDSVAA